MKRSFYGQTEGFFVITGMFFMFLIFFKVPSLTEENPTEGKKIYDNICISCHGENGISDTPGIPSFASGDRMNKTNDQLKKSIRNGINNSDNPAGIMPPFGGGATLNDKQMEDVIFFIRSLKE